MSQFDRGDREGAASQWEERLWQNFHTGAGRVQRVMCYRGIGEVVLSMQTDKAGAARGCGQGF